jgi:hypothetical protein
VLLPVESTRPTSWEFAIPVGVEITCVVRIMALLKCQKGLDVLSTITNGQEEENYKGMFYFFPYSSTIMNRDGK